MAEQKFYRANTNEFTLIDSLGPRDVFIANGEFAVRIAASGLILNPGVERN